MKTIPPKARTPRLAAVLENARDMYEAGTITEERFRELEVGCLAPPKVPDYSAQKIKRLRLKYHVSQPVLAGMLNTSLSTVRQWEIGAKHPGGPSLKLLSILERNGPGVLMA